MLAVLSGVQWYRKRLACSVAMETDIGSLEQRKKHIYGGHSDRKCLLPCATCTEISDNK